MYRKVIDHPQYLPEFIRGTLDYEAGKTMGRIYRVVPANSKLQTQNPKLGEASTKELVAKLNDANGWVRSTAFRLLLERKDKSSLALLRELWTPKVQQVTYEMLGPGWNHFIAQGTAPNYAAFNLTHLLGGPLFSGDVGSVLHAAGVMGTNAAALSSFAAGALTVISESGSLQESEAGKVGFLKQSRAVAQSWDNKLRFAQALAVGGWRGESVARGLANLAVANTSTNRWLRAAVLSGVVFGSETQSYLDELLSVAKQRGERQRTTLEPVLQDLSAVVASANTPDKLPVFLGLVIARGSTLSETEQSAFATGLGNGARAKGLGKDGRSALVTLASANPDTARRLGELFAAASKTVATASAPTPERLAAIDLLAHSDAATAGAALQSLIAPQTPNELQAAAVRALSQLPGAKAGEWFVERERWRSYTPPVRDAVLTAMLSQPALQLVLLDAVEKGVVQPWAVPANRRNPLLKHKDAAVAARATKAFQPQGAADRMKVYEDYKAVLALPANAKNGKAVFVKTCAACHQFAGEGQRVGPELTGVRLQPAEAILLHILVPDAEIYPGFTAYEAETKDGRSLTGLLTSDTPTSVTLRAAQGIEETILRSNLAKLTSSSISLMPNELEKTMTRQELADLMAFLKGQ